MASSNIETVLQEKRVFPPSPGVRQAGQHFRHGRLPQAVRRGGKGFRGLLGAPGARDLLWSKPFTKTLDESKAPFFRWFHDGELNASYNCLDRHLKTQPDKTAIIFEADDGKVTKITYQALYHEVCKFANALKAHGHQDGRPRADLHADVDPGGGGDAGLRAHRRHALGGVRRLLGQERAGAHHRRRRGGGDHRRRPVPRRQGDSAQAGGGRGARAWAAARRSSNVIVYKRTGSTVAMTGGARQAGGTSGQGPGRHLRARPGSTPSIRCSSSTPRAPPASPRASSTRPRGYLLWCMLTMKWVFDYKPSDVFWCTADVGWVTGHTYIVLRPAGGGRHRSDVRGRADLSRRRPLLEDDPGPQGAPCSTPRPRRSAR